MKTFAKNMVLSVGMLYLFIFLMIIGAVALINMLFYAL